MNKSRLLESLRGGAAPELLHFATTYHGKGGGGGSDIMAYLAMQQQAAQAAQALEFSKQVYQENKPWVEETRRMSREAGGMQLELMRDQKARGDEQWARYRQLFAPIEEKMAADAMKEGSAAQQAQAAAAAGADVEGSMAEAQAGRRRDMARMGLSVNDVAQDATSTALAKGLGKAGAMTGAAQQSRLRGMAMREGVANFGRGFPNTAAQAHGLGMSAGQGAIGAATAPISALNSAAGPHMQGMWNMANMYGDQARTYASMRDREDDGSAFWGALGTLGGAAISAYPWSSKDLKENRRKIAENGVLEQIKTLPVDEWNYKEGVADEGPHTGPMAEDVNARFGDNAAPGGKMIDLISMNGIALAGIKALAKKVDRLERLKGVA